MKESVTETRSSEELLAELLKLQKRTARQSLIRMIASLLVLAGIVVAVCILYPHVKAIISDVQTSLAEINSITADAKELIKNANTMITENTEAVGETVQKLNNVDFKKLNEAIASLNDVVKPLAALFK